MKVLAISDLHMPADTNKPMDIFGPQWENHIERIAEDWNNRVTDDDIVLIPGDITWAMRLEDAVSDLRFIGELPGKKILLRGNHDYWWSSVSRVRDKLTPGMYALQNDAVKVGNITFCGTRGWLFPGEGNAEDDKIYSRELKRLELSLDSAKRTAAGGIIICLTHFPPLLEARMDTEVTRLIERYGVSHAVYGHLHGNALCGAFDGEHNGVRYHLASCDGCGFKLVGII